MAANALLVISSVKHTETPLTLSWCLILKHCFHQQRNQAEKLGKGMFPMDSNSWRWTEIPGDGQMDITGDVLEMLFSQQESTHFN